MNITRKTLIIAAIAAFGLLSVMHAASSKPSAEEDQDRKKSGLNEQAPTAEEPAAAASMPSASTRPSAQGLTSKPQSKPTASKDKDNSNKVDASVVMMMAKSMASNMARTMKPTASADEKKPTATASKPTAASKSVNSEKTKSPATTTPRKTSSSNEPEESPSKSKTN